MCSTPCTSNILVWKRVWLLWNVLVGEFTRPQLAGATGWSSARAKALEGYLAGSGGYFLMKNCSCPVYWAAPGSSGAKAKALEGYLAGCSCFLMENRSCPVYCAAPGDSCPRNGCSRLPSGCQLRPPPIPHPLPVRDKVPRRLKWAHTGSPPPHRPAQVEARIAKLTCRSSLLRMQSVPVDPHRNKVYTGWKRKYQRGTTCLWYCMHCATELGDGWASSGKWHSPDHCPLASSTWTCSAPAAGPQGDGPTKDTLQAAQRGRDASVAILSSHLV